MANFANTIASMQATRGTNIMCFMAGVNNGLHDVAFYNSGAARDLASGKDASMLAASSFLLASTTSSERSSFCQNLMTELSEQMNVAQLALEISAYDGLRQYLGGQNNDKARDIQAMMEKNQLQKQQEKEDEATDAIYKQYQENTQYMKTLDAFNSDAEMQFKKLKEAADNQELLAKKQYYNYRNTQTSGNTFSLFNGSLDKALNPNSESNEGSNASSNAQNVSGASKMFFVA